MKSTTLRTLGCCLFSAAVTIPIVLIWAADDDDDRHHNELDGPVVTKTGETLYNVLNAPQGKSWIATGNGDAQFKMLVDRHNLPKRDKHEPGPVQIASYTQKAGSMSSVHAHEAVEIFYIISGELIDITDPETDPKFRIAKPGMVTIVHPHQKVIHWVPSKTEPVTGLVIWAPAVEEHNLIEHAHFLHGKWEAPFEREGVDRQFKEEELPPEIRAALKKAKQGN